MHNQHAGLSQALADQRITDRHEQATMPDWHAALARRAAAGNGQPAAGGSWRTVARPPRRPANPSPQLTEARITPTNGAAAPTQPRAQAGIIDHPLRHVLVWGASTLLALVASATVVSGLG